MTPFKNRSDAGKELADKLHEYGHRLGGIVLGLPRGGVPVAFEVARKLNLPLDVFIVRKLGVPGYEELAMGAIASGGVRVENEQVIQSLHIPARVFESVAREEEEELKRREETYRTGLPDLNVRGSIVILVDDGLATGSTMRAAVVALRKQQPQEIVVAVPVASVDACNELGNEADSIVCAITPEPFYSVGSWYEDFSQTDDNEVRQLLKEAHIAREKGGEP